MAKDRWDHKPADPACTDPVDRDKVDLEELWLSISEDDLRKVVLSFIRGGGRELPGGGDDLQGVLRALRRGI